MARHAPDKKSSRATKEDQRRKENLEKFDRLTPKAIRHIEESLEAQAPCSYCDSNGNAAKRDSEGNCIKCHGSKLVPDVDRRNWATEEIVSRVAPKPKASEIQIDDKRTDEEDLKDKLANAPAEAVNKAAEQILGLLGGKENAEQQ